MGYTKIYNTLFLDRDGVINKHLIGDYVKSPQEFIFLEGVVEALKELSLLFRHILIVSNQRGVGKGIMSMDDLYEIHKFMLDIINAGGGRIDKIYICTDIEESSPNRKPNIGMIHQALKDFPDIDLKKSWMVGDSRSDIQFANKAQISMALVGDKYNMPKDELRIDMYCPNLLTFAKQLKKIHI